MAIQVPDLSEPIRLATTLRQQSDLADQQKAESAQRLTEGQLNIKKLQMAIDEATKEHSENDQIKAIIAQGGDPQTVYQKLLPINPDKARVYLTNAQADVAQAQQQALLRAKTLEGQVAPEVATSVPQTTTAPIQTNLPGAGEAPQMSAPQVSPPATQRVPLPLPSVEVPFIGQPSTTIRPRSQQQLTLAEQARALFNAKLEAQKKLMEPITTPEGGITTIPIGPEGKPVIIQGQPKLSEIEKEAAPWLAQNPGKTLPDYVKHKAEDSAAMSQYGQELAAFNADPGLVKQFGPGPNGLAAKRQADQIKVHQSEAQASIAAQNALQQGAVKNVAPHLVTPATEAYAKDSKDYIAAAEAADTVNTFVNLARKGNKEAYAYSPVAGVLQINVAGQTKRINRNEIEAYGGAGSLFDKIQGAVGKVTFGASISPSVLNDMQELANAVGGNAKTAYQRKVQVTNQAFGSTFQPMDFSGGGSPSQGLSFTYQGKTLTFPDQESYDAAKAAAGIK